MLKKKSLSQKILELKTRSLKKALKCQDQSDQTCGDVKFLWKSLIEEINQNDKEGEKENLGSGESNLSNFKSKIGEEFSEIAPQVGKDNYQGSPSVSFEFEKPIPEVSLHEDENECILKPTSKNSRRELPILSNLSFKSNIATHEQSYEYRVIKQRSKSRKTTKSFGRNQPRTSESNRRLSSLGRRNPAQVQNSKKVQFTLSNLKLHEIRNLTLNYTYTRKRSVQEEGQTTDEKELKAFLDTFRDETPITKMNQPKHKTGMLTFKSARRQMCVPCFDDNLVHVFDVPNLQSTLVASKRDEDNDSSDSVIKFTIKKAYGNLRSRVDSYQRKTSTCAQSNAATFDDYQQGKLVPRHQPPPRMQAAPCREKTPENHVKLIGGWLIEKPTTSALEKKPSIKKRYDELLQKSEIRSKTREQSKQRSNNQLHEQASKKEATGVSSDIKPRKE